LVIGNPGLHFLAAGTWYLSAVRDRDALRYDRSKTLIEALLVTNLSTLALKIGMDDRSPNGEKYGWPSGHTSSSVCFAAVMHEYYGWKAGVPLYLLAGYTAASRLEDREHDLSDLVFGAALGWVVGHSVVKGELPQVAGFYVLPYGGRDAGGLMFLKRY
jgi:membrane-associated phospholipid phosphatase